MSNLLYLAPVKVSRLSTTFVKCRVSATENGQASDPTSGTIEFAFISEAISGDPEESDWNAGSWETASDGYWGKCLIGPDGTTALIAGSYDVWIRVTKSPEKVVDHVGVLSIY